MVRNGKGAANTNKNGLKFEKKVDILDYLKHQYTLIELNKNLYSFKDENGDNYFYTIKNGFYNYLEHYLDINYKDFLSKKLIPDNSIISLKTKTIHIFEIKYQETPGSTDEKIQTCDFKNKQFNKLIKSTDHNIEYNYIFNDWFKKLRYKDDLSYILSVNCYYYFNNIPLEKIIK